MVLTANINLQHNNHVPIGASWEKYAQNVIFALPRTTPYAHPTLTLPLHMGGWRFKAFVHM